MPPGHDYAHFLRHQVRLALPPNARRIDKTKLAALKLDHLIDSISGRSGDGRNDGPARPG